jgi:O-antigen ligase
MNSPSVQRTAITPLQWCAILIGFSVPLTVVADNLLLALILLGTLVSLKDISRVTISHPVARAAILLFSALLVATFYGITPWKEAFVILMKYIDLMFIPIFIFLFSNNTVRVKARYAFVIAMALTLAASYLVWMGILPVMTWMDPIAKQNNPVILHSPITQSNMMAFAVFLSLLEWRDANHSGLKKLAWAAFALLGTINIIFMVQGRTGYLILFVLLSWFAWSTFSRAMLKQNRKFNWQHKGLLILALLAGSVVAYQTSPHLHSRVTTAVEEYQAWVPGQYTSSIGDRLNFYSTALHIVKDNPLFGIGTGGLPLAYEQQVKGVHHLNNLHNEFLMISVQTGLVGLALMLSLFYTLWRQAPSLPTPFEQDAAHGLVLAYLLSCSLNSSLLDHADGLFFAFMAGLLFSGLTQKQQLT